MSFLGSNKLSTPANPGHFQNFKNLKISTKFQAKIHYKDSDILNPE